MEAIVATAISVVAILGLAHTFGIGRGFIDRFTVARAALGAVRGRMEALSVLDRDSDSLAAYSFFTEPFNSGGRETGIVEWRVAPQPDSLPPTGAELRVVTVVAKWGSGVERDSIRLTRLFAH